MKKGMNLTQVPTICHLSPPFLVNRFNPYVAVISKGIIVKMKANSSHFPKFPPIASIINVIDIDVNKIITVGK
jgi:hypothetical protein